MPYERLIGYFDILGFKNLVLSETLESMVGRFGQIYTTIGAAAVRHEAQQQDVMSVGAIAERYEQIETADLGGIRAAFEATTGMTLLLMSDSLVVYSHPLEREGGDQYVRQLSTLLRVSRTVIDKLLEYELPARGALGFGELYVDAANGIYVGKGLVEAYEYAESQEWIGVVAAASLTDDLTKMHQSFTMEKWRQGKWLACADWDYLPYDVPFKKGPQRMYAVNWATTPNARHLQGSNLFRRGVGEAPEVAVKYTNTLSFLNQASRDGFQGIASR
jgi:hypothetical protein